MKHNLSRREFLRRAGLGVAAGAVAAAGASQVRAAAPAPKTPPLNYPVYLPAVQMVASDVVRVHASGATHWDFATGWYGNAVDQAAVDAMLSRGLKEVTHQTTTAAAWDELLPGYAPGKKIAVKVNLNNASKDDADNVIDALPQVVIALLKTLCSDYGAAQQDVMIYDALRPMPYRFYNPVHAAFPQAGLFDNGTGYGVKAGFTHMHPSLKLAFTHSNLKGERWLTDVLYKATYLINLPIVKKHTSNPVTLGFKNHFGSTEKLGLLGTNDDPHIYIDPRLTPLYSPAAVPLVDINANPNIRGKTVLTIGDGLFGAPSVGAVPVKWVTFGSQAPNSLLFARDPVAVECVMCDLLRAEFGFGGFPLNSAYDFLVNAEARGLGRYEMGDPWGAGYSKIRYKVVEM